MVITISQEKREVKNRLIISQLIIDEKIEMPEYVTASVNLLLIDTENPVLKSFHIENNRSKNEELIIE